MVTKDPGTSEPSSASRAVRSVTACAGGEKVRGEKVSVRCAFVLCYALIHKKSLHYHSVDFDDLVPDIHQLRGRHAGQKRFYPAAS